MAQFSFDIVSEYNVSEITNVVEQAQREIRNRYDLKNSPAEVSFESKEKSALSLKAQDEHQLNMVLDIVRKRLAARQLSQNVIDTSTSPEKGNPWRWVIPLKQGIKTDQAKKINKKISEHFPKIKTQIQGEEIRVTGSSKDDLQAVMQLVRQLDLDFPVQFTNYR